MPMVAQAVLLGAMCGWVWRITSTLKRACLRPMPQLVERAVAIVELLGARVQSAAEARQRLGLAPARSQ